MPTFTTSPPFLLTCSGPTSSGSAWPLCCLPRLPLSIPPCVPRERRPPKHCATNSAAPKMSSYEWLIGTRYLRSTHRRGFVSFVALMSVLGLMLGVAVLIVVLSVMNGFERELRSRILSVTAHATLMGEQGALEDWRAARDAALAKPDVIAAAPYIEEQSMLAHGGRITGALVRGVLPPEEIKATGLAQRVTSGHINDLRHGKF